MNRSFAIETGLYTPPAGQPSVPPIFMTRSILPKALFRSTFEKTEQASPALVADVPVKVGVREDPMRGENVTAGRSHGKERHPIIAQEDVRGVGR